MKSLNMCMLIFKLYVPFAYVTPMGMTSRSPASSAAMIKTVFHFVRTAIDFPAMVMIISAMPPNGSVVSHAFTNPILTFPSCNPTSHARLVLSPSLIMLCALDFL